MQVFQLLPERASSLAGATDRLYLAVLGVTGFFTMLVAGLVVVFAIRYRRGANPRPPGATGPTGSLRLELLWSFVPLVVFLAFFWAGARIFLRGARPPRDGPVVNVVAKQWMWKLQHATGHREINRLHVPLGEVVRLRMTSEDVIHSFFVPAFRLKQDVLPGTYTYAWFEATRTGVYPLYCAEYCGAKHSQMIGEIVVLEPRGFERWLETGPAPPDPAEAGSALYERLRCGSCHDAGAERRGPPLGGIVGRPVPLAGGRTAVRDDVYMRDAIVDPDAQIVAGYEPTMPTYAGQVNADEVLQLQAYLESLGTGGAER
jgi:cytochrome c oxidase subunit 2